MHRHATILGLTLAVAALSMNEAAAQPQPKNEAVTKLLKTQLQAAQRAQRAAINKMQVKQVYGFDTLANSNHPNAEEAYLWSVRWLHAQRDLSETKDERITAFVDHQMRMKQLRVKFTRLIGDGKGGFLTPADAAVAAPAVEWYLAEAELWLLKERGN